MTKYILKPLNLGKNQRGFASITVAIVMITVIGLLMVSFAQLSRREQQTALDKQLAVQANFAAESGINDVLKLIKDTGNDESALAALNSPTCLPDSKLPNSLLASGVKYSCVIVDVTPSTLQKDLPANTAWNTTYSTASTLNNGSLSIQWQTKEGEPTKTVWPDGSPQVFKPVGSGVDDWGDHMAVLEVNIIPIDGNGAGQFDKDYLYDNSFTTYLYPTRSIGAIAYNTNHTGPIVGGVCASDTSCKVTITGLNGSKFYVRIVGRYDNSQVTLSSNDGSVKFIGGQAVIDSTGKARNVLKRLQVRVPIDGLVHTDELPSQAIQAGNLCKRLSSMPTATNAIPATVDDNGSCIPGNP